MKLISVEHASIGALEDGSRAICITLEDHAEQYVVYGLLLRCGDTAECSLGPLPAMAAIKAKEIVRQWAEGFLPVPYSAASEPSSADV